MKRTSLSAVAALAVLATIGCSSSPSNNPDSGNPADSGNPGDAGGGVSVSVSPSAVTVYIGAVQSFSATVTGSANHSVTWSLQEGSSAGTIAPDGTYTASSVASTYHVVATSVADPTKSAVAAVTVTSTPTVSVAISPTTASVAAGAAEQFTATVSGSTGSTAVTWTVTEGVGGTVSSSGLYTAPSTAGTFHVVATSVADTTKSATATVTVTSGAVVGITLSPTSASINTGGTQTFIATVTGSANTAVSWSVQESTGGAVTTGGVYTAPTTPGTYHVIATAQADTTKTAVATVSVAAVLGNGVTVSGTISYAGAKTGPVYIALVSGGCSGCGAQSGGFINWTTGMTTANYTLRGVQGGGSYNVQVFLDVLGTQSVNTNIDPNGSAAVSLNGSNVTGANITLGDPAALTPSAPTSVGGFVSGDGVILGWSGSQNADHFKIYSMTTIVSTCPGSSAGYTTSKTVPAGSNNGPQAIFSGLTSGATYCFLVTAVNNGTESLTGTVFGPVHISSPTGAGTYTVTGFVHFAGITPTGPMYYALAASGGNCSGGPSTIYFSDAIAPASPQTFTVTGVPNGTYGIYTFLDQGNLGWIGPTAIGDTNTNHPPSVTVAGSNVNAPTVTLAAGNALASVQTQTSSGGGGNQYNLNFSVSSNTKVAVAATLTSGPGLTSVVDLGGGGGSGGRLQTNINLGSTSPAVSQAYGIGVTYLDGSNEVLTGTVTGVVKGVATLTSPANNATGVSTTPSFNWTLPGNLPVGGTQEIQVNPNNGNTAWDSVMPFSATLPVVYNADGSACVSPLSSATQYSWGIRINDAYGNQSQIQQSFTTQ